jgi:RNA polymerase sigma factor (sigma-70 family)
MDRGRHDVPPATHRLTATVHAAALGDHRAWNALVHRFTPALRRVARGYRLAPQDVDDVVQASWLLLLESLHTLREPEAIGAWLVTTVRRQALRARQREVRELLTEAPLPERQAAPDCPATAVVDAERESALRDAVGRLSGRQRALLESLIAAPDRSYAEVSALLDMPVGSIGPTRERGLSRLRADEGLVRVMAP